MGDLVDEIEIVAQEEAFNKLDKIGFATAFVQNLPYTVDAVTTPYDEYPRYPVETLVDNGGDCEDTAILLASLLDSMGYSVVLIIFPETPDTAGHAGIGVQGGGGIYGTHFEYEGGNYFYIETTDTGWRVGEIPEEYEGVEARLYRMVPTPILTHTWEEATGIGSNLEFNITVENLGSATADGVYILAGFDAGEGILWNAEESQPFELSVNQRITVNIILQVPTRKHTRLVVQIIDNGHAVDESYSEWFDT